MDVLLLGASGRIGSRTTSELLDRGHRVTGVSRSGSIEDLEDQGLTTIAGDATNPDDVAKLATGHDGVISALGPGEEESPDVLTTMIETVIDGLREANVDRLVWTGGAGGLHVGQDTRLVETEDFPDEWRPIATAAIEAYEIIEAVDDLRWSYVAPAAFIEPGERTGSYRTAAGELVTDEGGESYITMEDFAIALVDELEEGDGVHTYLGTGY